MRTGEHRGDDIAKLNTRVRPPSLHSPNAIYLAARNDAADAINRRRLAALPGSAMFSVAETTWPVSDTPAETRLELRRGARVVVLRNDASDRYANGSRGTVESWNTEGVSLTLDENGSTVVLARHTWEYREVFFNEEEDEIQSRVIGTFTQIPLRLGWALSIHKSQGMTLGDIVVDLGTGAFAAGQTYVALSRAKSLSNIVLAKRIIASDVRVDPLVLAYFLALRTSGAGHV